MNETSLELSFIDQFHPSELNIKADHWYSKYKLRLLEKSYEFGGWFTGRFWSLDGDKIIVFEKYINENFDSELIKLDKDVESRLFLIDFRRNAVTKFSRLRGGRFEVLELTKNGRIVYLKKQYDKTGEYKVDLDSLKFELINS
ncbi:hypothetical protein MHTCC0001_29510 [Flavobacteriaceae bacterium MHTCC 0001]